VQLTFDEKKDHLKDLVDKFFTDTLPTGELLLDEQFVQQVGTVRDYLVGEKLALSRVSALQRLGHGVSPQARVARAIVAPLLKSAGEIAQSYRDALLALKEQANRSIDLWSDRNKRQIEGYSAYDWARLTILGLPLALYFSGGLGALTVRQFITSLGIKSATVLYVSQMFSSILSDPMSSLYDGANTLLADWWLKPKPIQDVNGLSEQDFRKAYDAKVSELKNSTDPGLKALAPKLEAAYYGQEAGPVAWAKRNWKWLVIGGFAAVIIPKVISNRK